MNMDHLRKYWRNQARDNGGNLTCALCTQVIQVSFYKWPHPMSLEVDHIVPKALGGRDTVENTQPAHRTCNRHKSDDPFANSVLKRSRNW